MIVMIKKALEAMPFPIGAGLSMWPYRYRIGIGAKYRETEREIESFDTGGIDFRKEYIFNKVLSAILRFYDVPFFHELYKSAGISVRDIQSFDDLKSLPILTKDILREFDIEQRSAKFKGRYLVNTGGSSGSPLSFYVTPRQIPAEWAHMHAIWQRLGFKESDLKLVFSGRNLGRNPIWYDGLRHSFVVNAYVPFSELESPLRKIIWKKKVRFLHGYPSAIAEFASNIKENAPDLLADLKLQLKGVLLGSEYPAPVYRRVIEETFGAPTISWYGHTERAVLAWEREEPFLYAPFQTYGFAEAVRDEMTGTWRLVATSYRNHASPFIRYDTGDRIEAVTIEDGMLSAFRIAEGRVGDYVIDRSDNKISLTALIFGRHHKLFGVARHIQVRQVSKGVATILITPNSNWPSNMDFAEYFDLSGLDMGIEFKMVKEPIRTAAGKVPLKVD